MFKPLSLPSAGPALPLPHANPQPTDREITDAIALGEEWAADALYARIQPVVDRTLRRILRSTGPDYDDLVQAAFERIIMALSRKPLDGAYQLRAWSAAVASHVALDWLRRRTREQRLFRSEVDLPGERAGHNAEHRIEARSEVERVQRILARMKTESAQTLMLHDVLGYDLLEVAQMLGVSAAAAQSRLVRSRKELLRRARVPPKEGGRS